MSRVRALLAFAARSTERHEQPVVVCLMQSERDAPGCNTARICQ